MSETRFHTTTAISLCLFASTQAVSAQELASDDLALFAEPAQACIADPSGEACAELRGLVTECADDPSRAPCVELFAEGPALLDDSEAVARVETILAELRAELPDLDPPATEDLPEEALEAARPEAEGQMLRTEDEPNVHSAPPVVDGASEDLPEPEATVDVPVPLEDEAAAPDDPELDALQEALREAEAEEAEAPEAMSDDADVSAEEADPAPEASADEVALPDDPELEALQEAMREAEADAVSDTAADEAEAEALGRALEEAAAAVETPEAEARRETLEALAAADEVEATEAPELLIEEAPEEELVVPTEAPRALDEREQAAVDALLDEPDVATALGLLGGFLDQQAAPDPETEAPTETEIAAAAAAQLEDEAAEAMEPAEVIEEQITADQLRSSGEDFASRLALDVEADTTARASSRNRDLERAGLAALGALAVGMVLNQNRVVARSDERVVVDQGEGQLQLWRDDDAILLEDGSTRRIERFADGSTRTIWERADGTRVITVRDVTGRVLRRDRVLADGTFVALLDDTRAYDVIDVSILPPPRTRELRITERTDPALAIAMLEAAEADARAFDRGFSLRQIRETRELRELVPLLSPDLITFETNRANVRPAEAAKLLQVGRLMERLLAENPREIFLIEGHTDATGPAAFNLALSDRRAESVALALTEFFNIPPENLVVQGYGKRYLRIPTLESEERNRRVAIRRITPLLRL